MIPESWHWLAAVGAAAAGGPLGIALAKWAARLVPLPPAAAPVADAASVGGTWHDAPHREQSAPADVAGCAPQDHVSNHATLADTTADAGSVGHGYDRRKSDDVRYGAALGTAALFFVFTLMMLGVRCQQTPEVQPDTVSRLLRVVYHLTLVALLVASILTDLRDYVIPDEITLPGMLLGVLGATLSGDLQIIHLWVDWRPEIPGLHGPEIPEWIRQHRHWHGLAVSLAGMAAGAGLAGLVRGLSKAILGREALGFGDVTLMAMIGSFVGWQPVVIAFALAPMCGLLFGLIYRLGGGRSYLPYGPWLAAATMLVLLGWRWIWMFEAAWSPTSRFAVRRFFSDGVGLAIVAGIATATMAALLAALRLYRAAPGRRA